MLFRTVNFYRQFINFYLKNIVIDYKKYIKDFAIHDSKLDSYEKDGVKYAKEEVDKFLKESSGIINYLVKEAPLTITVLVSSTSIISGSTITTSSMGFSGSKTTYSVN